LFNKELNKSYEDCLIISLIVSLIKSHEDCLIESYVNSWVNKRACKITSK